MPWMRGVLAVTVSLTALSLATAATSSTAGSGSGLLVGRTVVTLGCPGPAREGVSCPRWHPFPHARFTIRLIGPSGQPLPQVIRVVSDAQARFAVRLDRGDYLITPLTQAHTRGGKSITVHIRPGGATRITVRYLGYPMMV